MPDPIRLNRVIELFEQGTVAFGTRVAMLGINPIGTYSHEAQLGGDPSAYDFVVFDMEHQWFDPPALAVSLQFLLNPRTIAESGSVRPAIVPFVRIPANGRERNQWIVKQALDAGVFGIVLPQLETVEDAEAAVIACRYPQERSAPDEHPRGERGYWSSGAHRYWGIDVAEYHRKADLWPLDPAGELLLIPMIETAKGVEELPRILEAVPGIGAVWAGYGDLAVSLGCGNNVHDPVVESALSQIVKTCDHAQVPCAIVASPRDVEQRLEQGYRMIFTSPTLVDAANVAGRKLARRDEGAGT